MAFDAGGFIYQPTMKQNVPFVISCIPFPRLFTDQLLGFDFMVMCVV